VSDNPGPISRLKARAAGEVSAAPLASRLVAGASSRYDAATKLDETLAEAGFSLHGLWTLSPAQQAVAQLWWLSAVGWETAERFFARLTSATQRQFIDRDGVPWCEGLCAAAETYTTEAVRCQSQVEVQVSVPPPQIKQLKDLPVTDDLGNPRGHLRPCARRPDSLAWYESAQAVPASTARDREDCAPQHGGVRTSQAGVGLSYYSQYSTGCREPGFRPHSRALPGWPNVLGTLPDWPGVPAVFAYPTNAGRSGVRV